MEYLVRANETGICEPCEKKTCLVCNSIRTTTTSTLQRKIAGKLLKLKAIL